jgi:Uma2 family endonuclease
MVTGTAVPVEEYLRTNYDPDMEYVDGQLVERSVGERRHSRTQTILIGLLRAR